ncbi:MAG: DUF4033 domain-containing protein [Ruminococcus sp.]|nr:DUF4033 domain-containing protein [Ruminococcus sp.]
MLCQLFRISVIAEGEYDTLFLTLLPCVCLCLVSCKVPHQRIALEVISTAAALEPEISELACDTDIRLELCSL